MLVPKEYQVETVDKIRQYLKIAQRHRAAGNPNWADSSLSEFGHNNQQTSFVGAGPAPINGLDQAYPCFCLKVPTAGGKTLIAIETVRQYINHFKSRPSNLVVWITPSETIYQQTIKRLRRKNDPYRQILDQASRQQTIIIEKDKQFAAGITKANLVVLVLMIQSTRRNRKENLRVFADNGRHDSYFPADSDHASHRRLIEEIKNLDCFSGATIDSPWPSVKTSLGNIIRIERPLMIIDEYHRAASNLSQKTIASLNPTMVVGLSATPPPRTNILVAVSGQQLNDAAMVKLSLHVRQSSSWRAMLSEILDKRSRIEEEANRYQQRTNVYIRPLALIQVERTGKDQRGRWVHSDDVKEHLINLGVAANEIAIKTSSQNDIEDIDLTDRDCPIRWVITKNALREGWDCPFAYILGVIPKTSDQGRTGLVQLIGRILRQPYATKTKVGLLDESHVYYCQGENQSVINQIRQGFCREGLQDIAYQDEIIRDPTGPDQTRQRRNRIRPQYPQKLLMPIWLMGSPGDYNRRFDYKTDIRSRIDFAQIDQAKIIESIKASLVGSNHRSRPQRAVNIVSLDQNRFVTTNSRQIDPNRPEINAIEMTDRLGQRPTIDNLFLARRIATQLTAMIKNDLGQSWSSDSLNYIYEAVVLAIEKQQHQQERDIFQKLVKAKKLVFRISQDERTKYQLPRTDPIDSQLTEQYQLYLYEDCQADLNQLERRVANYLDSNDQVIWWVRNKTNKGWYVVAGWQKQRIKPDFIAAVKTPDNGVDLRLIIESKGDHLLETEDTAYKQAVFDYINAEFDQTTPEATSSLIEKQPASCRFEIVAEKEVGQRLPEIIDQTKEPD